ncbi:hypothetical protein ACFWPH_10925 [Nocardia sp. NPDC058499]|uniref:hypothetical protein n=1 Tax=Nocardia sp. NPDC058499 TaxID=3346530 RepID=UPI0036493E17
MRRPISRYKSPEEYRTNHGSGRSNADSPHASGRATTPAGVTRVPVPISITVPEPSGTIRALRAAAERSQGRLPGICGSARPAVLTAYRWPGAETTTRPRITTDAD